MVPVFRLNLTDRWQQPITMGEARLVHWYTEGQLVTDMPVLEQSGQARPHPFSDRMIDIQNLPRRMWRMFTIACFCASRWPGCCAS